MAKSYGSYAQIIRATALVGGASAVTVVLGIIRTKAIALLVGPAGIGLMGIYQSLVLVGCAFAGMGVSRSGVRQIAESVATGDSSTIARTTSTLRRTSLLLGLFGAVVLGSCARRISQYTFGGDDRALEIALLGLAVLFSTVAAGQTALLQGLQRLNDMVRGTVLGPALGVVFGIPIVWQWGDNGIVPMLVVVAAATLAGSWWFARRVPVAVVALTWPETLREGRGLLRLGIAFMASGIAGSGATYLIRAMISRQMGIEAVGLYTAAFTLSSIYVGFILQAMSADFYPRLTAKANDHAECNRVVNQQAEVSLLLAVPGVLATLVLAPKVLELFYSAQFAPSADILRWQVLGVMGRVASWPMGFIILAQGRGKLFFGTEVAAHAVHVALLWFSLSRWGLEGAGAAFGGMYAFHLVMLNIVSRRLSRFEWSTTNRQFAARLLPPVGFVFLLPALLPSAAALLLGLVTTVAVSIYCAKALLARAGPLAITSSIANLAARVGLPIASRERKSPRLSD